MALSGSFPTDDPAGLPIADTRKVLAGLIVKNTSGTPRLGVFYGAASPLVTGTAGLNYSVGQFTAATSRTGAGVELVSNDGSVNALTTAAPASNARIDVIWTRAQFTASGDSTPAVQIGVTQGTASGTPSKPAIPAGALELAVAEFPSSASTTAGATITQTAQFTTVDGGTVPFRNTTEMDLWTTALPNQEALDLSSKVKFKWDGSDWVASGPAEVAVIPSSVTGGTVAADGSFTFTGASAISLAGVGITAFKHIRIELSVSASASADLRARVRTSAPADITTSTYPYNLTEQAIAGSPSRVADGAGTFALIGSVETGLGDMILDVFDLAEALPTRFMHRGGDSAMKKRDGVARNTNSTAYPSLTIYPSTGTITGQGRVIGVLR